jgi:hypothetical protein
LGNRASFVSGDIDKTSSRGEEQQQQNRDAVERRCDRLGARPQLVIAYRDSS